MLPETPRLSKQDTGQMTMSHPPSQSGFRTPSSKSVTFRANLTQHFRGTLSEGRVVKNKVDTTSSIMPAPAFLSQKSVLRQEIITRRPKAESKSQQALVKTALSSSARIQSRSEQSGLPKRSFSSYNSDVFDEDEEDVTFERNVVADIINISLPDAKRSRRMPSVAPFQQRSATSSPDRYTASPVPSQIDVTGSSPPPAEATLQVLQDQIDLPFKEETTEVERLPIYPYSKRLLEDVNLSELMGVKSSDEFKDRVNIATREEFEAIGDELAARYQSLIKKIADGIQQRATVYTAASRSLQDHSAYLQTRAESIRKTQERLKESGKLMFEQAALHRQI